MRIEMDDKESQAIWTYVVRGILEEKSHPPPPSRPRQNHRNHRPLNIFQKSRAENFFSSNRSIWVPKDARQIFLISINSAFFGTPIDLFEEEIFFAVFREK